MYEIPLVEHKTMNSFLISRNNDTLKVGFNPAQPAQNDVIVKDVVARLQEMEMAGELAGGGVIKINGPASLPVTAVIIHKIAHIFAAVAAFDPKMGKNVVVISHGPDYAVGDLID